MGTKVDPAFYYRELSVLFVHFAAAMRGLTPDQYIAGYNTGLFNKSGKQLVTSSHLSKLSKQEQEHRVIKFAKLYGEPGLQKIWKMGEAEDALFGEDAPGS